MLIRVRWNLRQVEDLFGSLVRNISIEHLAALEHFYSLRRLLSGQNIFLNSISQRVHGFCYQNQRLANNSRQVSTENIVGYITD